MKNKFLRFMIFLSVCFLMSCTSTVHHSDPFYNVNESDFPRDHLPIINPVEATRERPSDPWNLHLFNALYVDLPKKQEQDVLEVYMYIYVEELEKFAVKAGVIMAYSPYVDRQAAPYVQDNYYHWYVMVPSEEITKGFHTEDEFQEYIETLGIQYPDWLTPDEAFDTFLDTGCLDWYPDCKSPTPTTTGSIPMP
jgi:hypothetical protein